MSEEPKRFDSRAATWVSAAVSVVTIVGFLALLGERGFTWECWPLVLAALILAGLALRGVRLTPDGVACVVAAINAAAFCFAATADSSLLPCVVVAFVPTILTCCGVLLTRGSAVTFVLATTCCLGVCFWSLLVVGAVYAEWVAPPEHSQMYDAVTWGWFCQFPPAVLALLLGFFTHLSRLGRGESGA
ncbi:unnamed protein product [Gemmata massiliana]|uniref:Uncharacterized protein n=1 Tax=Gemmata massiliana TaxID=1210884 RepID=A0A6P2CZW1_9BACT|nr:unnamed protein product [Gemmata massiliana]